MKSAAFTQPAHISNEEWALRVKLAQCYHLVDWFGWSEAIFNHISARLPGPAHHYLVNPSGSITPKSRLPTFSRWTFTAISSKRQSMSAILPDSPCTRPYMVRETTSSV